MTVTRSPRGIANYKVLHRVDLIVYSEGGNAEQLKADPKKYIYSIDSEFWGALFEKFEPSLKVKVKSLGPKNNVLPYAQKISSGELDDSIVVLDRDHDEHKGIIIEHPRIIYTHGYSWENDAWCSLSVIGALSRKHPERALDTDAIKNIKMQYHDFSTTIKRLVFVDVICSCQNIQGIPDKFGDLVNVFGGITPSINKANFRLLISSARKSRTAPLKYHGRREILPLTDCYGKLFAEFAYGVFSHHYKLITGKPKIVRDHADQIIARSLADLDETDDTIEISKYYKDKITEAVRHLPRRKSPIKQVAQHT